MGGTNSPSGCHLCKRQERSLRVLRILWPGARRRKTNVTTVLSLYKKPDPEEDI